MSFGQLVWDDIFGKKKKTAEPAIVPAAVPAAPSPVAVTSSAKKNNTSIADVAGSPVLDSGSYLHNSKVGLDKMNTSVTAPDPIRMYNTPEGQVVIDKGQVKLIESGSRAANRTANETALSDLRGSLGTTDAGRLEELAKIREAFVSKSQPGQTALAGFLAGRGLGGSDIMSKGIAKYMSGVNTDATLNESQLLAQDEEQKMQKIQLIDSMLGRNTSENQNMLNSSMGNYNTGVSQKLQADQNTVQNNLGRYSTLANIQQADNALQTDIWGKKASINQNQDQFNKTFGLETQKYNDAKAEKRQAELDAAAERRRLAWQPKVISYSSGNTTSKEPTNPEQWIDWAKGKGMSMQEINQQLAKKFY